MGSMGTSAIISFGNASYEASRVELSLKYVDKHDPIRRYDINFDNYITLSTDLGESIFLLRALANHPDVMILFRNPLGKKKINYTSEIPENYWINSSHFWYEFLDRLGSFVTAGGKDYLELYYQVQADHNFNFWDRFIHVLVAAGFSIGNWLSATALGGAVQTELEHQPDRDYEMESPFLSTVDRLVENAKGGAHSMYEALLPIANIQRAADETLPKEERLAAGSFALAQTAMLARIGNGVYGDVVGRQLQKELRVVDAGFEIDPTLIDTSSFFRGAIGRDALLYLRDAALKDRAVYHSREVELNSYTLKGHARRRAKKIKKRGLDALNAVSFLGREAIFGNQFAAKLLKQISRKNTPAGQAARYTIEDLSRLQEIISEGFSLQMAKKIQKYSEGTLEKLASEFEGGMSIAELGRKAGDDLAGPFKSLDLAIKKLERKGTPEEVAAAYDLMHDVCVPNFTKLSAIESIAKNEVKNKYGRPYYQKALRPEAVSDLYAFLQSVFIDDLAVAQGKGIKVKMYMYKLDFHPSLNLREVAVLVREHFHNAVKYTPEGGTISIKWNKELQALEITNTGPGIHNVSGALARGNRGEAGPAQASGGNQGLGLANAKQRAEEILGWGWHLESKPSHETLVRLTPKHGEIIAPE